MAAADYQSFIRSKSQWHNDHGIKVGSLPSFLYDFQAHLVEWALRKGRAAIFADCGLGKTALMLAWANEIVKQENKPILIVAPLAVVPQTVEEGKKFGIPVSRDGKEKIQIVNYDRLHQVDPNQYIGVICDESSILKSYSGSTRNAIIDFMRPAKYRLLCSATPSPNDYTELGNSCEALGIMRRVEMLASYFVHDSGNTSKWRLRGHGKDPFWQFVASWARAIRKPSDIGFDDTKFVLPELIHHEHVLPSPVPSGSLFVTIASTLEEQRAERKRTLVDRCEKVAEIANQNNDPFIAWCSLNDESQTISKLVNGCVDVSGSMSEEDKEESFSAFRRGEIRAIVTKPTMAAFGLNWQHCNQMTFFPSHSHEQYYQALRRCWRFGQSKPVNVHIVTTEAEHAVLSNLLQKEHAANDMFKEIIKNMKAYYKEKSQSYIPSKKMEIPQWLSA